MGSLRPPLSKAIFGRVAGAAVLTTMSILAVRAMAEALLKSLQATGPDGLGLFAMLDLGVDCPLGEVLCLSVSDTEGLGRKGQL